MDIQRVCRAQFVVLLALCLCLVLCFVVCHMFLKEIDVNTLFENVAASRLLSFQNDDHSQKSPKGIGTSEFIGLASPLASDCGALVTASVEWMEDSNGELANLTKPVRRLSGKNNFEGVSMDVDHMCCSFMSSTPSYQCNVLPCLQNEESTGDSLGWVTRVSEKLFHSCVGFDNGVENEYSTVENGPTEDNTCASEVIFPVLVTIYLLLLCGDLVLVFGLKRNHLKRIADKLSCLMCFTRMPSNRVASRGFAQLMDNSIINNFMRSFAIGFTNIAEKIPQVLETKAFHWMAHCVICIAMNRVHSEEKKMLQTYNDLLLQHTLFATGKQPTFKVKRTSSWSALIGKKKFNRTMMSWSSSSLCTLSNKGAQCQDAFIGVLDEECRCQHCQKVATDSMPSSLSADSQSDFPAMVLDKKHNIHCMCSRKRRTQFENSSVLDEYTNGLTDCCIFGNMQQSNYPSSENTSLLSSAHSIRNRPPSPINEPLFLWNEHREVIRYESELHHSTYFLRHTDSIESLDGGHELESTFPNAAFSNKRAVSRSSDDTESNWSLLFLTETDLSQESGCGEPLNEFNYFLRESRSSNLASVAPDVTSVGCTANTDMPDAEAIGRVTSRNYSCRLSSKVDTHKAVQPARERTSGKNDFLQNKLVLDLSENIDQTNKRFPSNWKNKQAKKTTFKIDAASTLPKEMNRQDPQCQGFTAWRRPCTPGCFGLNRNVCPTVVVPSSGSVECNQNFASTSQASTYVVSTSGTTRHSPPKVMDTHSKPRFRARRKWSDLRKTANGGKQICKPVSSSPGASSRSGGKALWPQLHVILPRAGSLAYAMEDGVEKVHNNAPESSAFRRLPNCVKEQKENMLNYSNCRDVYANDVSLQYVEPMESLHLDVPLPPSPSETSLPSSASSQSTEKIHHVQYDGDMVQSSIGGWVGSHGDHHGEDTASCCKLKASHTVSVTTVFPVHDVTRQDQKLYAQSASSKMLPIKKDSLDELESVRYFIDYKNFFAGECSAQEEKDLRIPKRKQLPNNNCPTLTATSVQPTGVKANSKTSLSKGKMNASCGLEMLADEDRRDNASAQRHNWLKQNDLTNGNLSHNALLVPDEETFALSDPLKVDKTQDHKLEMHPTWTQQSLERNLGEGHCLHLAELKEAIEKRMKSQMNPESDERSRRNETTVERFTGCVDFHDAGVFEAQTEGSVQMPDEFCPTEDDNQLGLKSASFRSQWDERRALPLKVAVEREEQVAEEDSGSSETVDSTEEETNSFESCNFTTCDIVHPMYVTSSIPCQENQWQGKTRQNSGGKTHLRKSEPNGDLLASSFKKIPETPLESVGKHSKQHESSCAYQDDELISGIRRVLEHISEIQNSKDYTEASFADLAASGASLLQQLLNNVDIDDLQEIENSLEVVAKSPCFLKKLPSPDIVASAEKQKSSCSLFQRDGDFMAGPTIHQNQHSDFIGTVDPDPSCSSPDCFEALKEKDTCVDNCDTRSSFRIHHPSRDADQHREQCEVFKTVSAKDRHVMHHCLPYSNNDSTFQLSLVLPHRDLEAGECKYQDPLIDPHHIAEHQHEPGLLSVAWQPDERFLKHSVTCEDFANKSACSNAYSEASSGNEKHQRITKTLSSATYNLENLSEANVANSESNSELMLKQLSNADIVGMSEDKTLRSNSTEGTHGGRRSSLHADIHKLLSPWENDWMSCCSGEKKYLDDRGNTSPTNFDRAIFNKGDHCEQPAIQLTTVTDDGLIPEDDVQAPLVVNNTAIDRCVTERGFHSVLNNVTFSTARSHVNMLRPEMNHFLFPQSADDMQSQRRTSPVYSSNSVQSIEDFDASNVVVNDLNETQPYFFMFDGTRETQGHSSKAFLESGNTWSTCSSFTNVSVSSTSLISTKSKFWIDHLQSEPEKHKLHSDREKFRGSCVVDDLFNPALSNMFSTIDKAGSLQSYSKAETSREKSSSFRDNLLDWRSSKTDKRKAAKHGHSSKSAIDSPSCLSNKDVSSLLSLFEDMPEKLPSWLISIDANGVTERDEGEIISAEHTDKAKISDYRKHQPQIVDCYENDYGNDTETNSEIPDWLEDSRHLSRAFASPGSDVRCNHSFHFCPSLQTTVKDLASKSQKKIDFLNTSNINPRDSNLSDEDLVNETIASAMRLVQHNQMLRRSRKNIQWPSLLCKPSYVEPPRSSSDISNSGKHFLIYNPDTRMGTSFSTLDGTFNRISKIDAPSTYSCHQEKRASDLLTITNNVATKPVRLKEKWPTEKSLRRFASTRRFNDFAAGQPQVPSTSGSAALSRSFGNRACCVVWDVESECSLSFIDHVHWDGPEIGLSPTASFEDSNQERTNIEVETSDTNQDKVLSLRNDDVNIVAYPWTVEAFYDDCPSHRYADERLTTADTMFFASSGNRDETFFNFNRSLKANYVKGPCEIIEVGDNPKLEVCDQFSKRTVLGDLQVMEAESRHQEKDFCLRSKNLTDEPLIICRQGVSCETNVSERFCEICRLIRAGIEASKNPVQLNHLRSTTILHLSDLSKRGFEAPFECPATCSPAFTTFSSISAVEAPASGEEHLQNKSTTGPLPKGKLNVIEPQAFELRSTINWPVVVVKNGNFHNGDASKKYPKGVFNIKSLTAADESPALISKTLQLLGRQSKENELLEEKVVDSDCYHTESRFAVNATNSSKFAKEAATETSFDYEYEKDGCEESDFTTVIQLQKINSTHTCAENSCSDARNAVVEQDVDVKSETLPSSNRQKAQAAKDGSCL